MKFFVLDAELSNLEARLTQPWGAEVLAATVSIAWHLRQRDSARALRLVDGVLPLLPPAPAAGPWPDAHRARASLAACEASALLCDFEVAERRLLDARRHLDAAADPCAEGDAWLVETQLAKMRVQRRREMDAHEQAVAFFERIDAPDRLALARVWLGFERTYARREIDPEVGAAPSPREFPQTAVAWDALWSASRALTVNFQQPAESARLYAHAAGRAHDVGMVRLEIVALINAGAAMQGLGDLDQAAEYFEAAANRAMTASWPTLIGTANTRIGELMRTLGALDESRGILADAIVALSIGAPGMHLAIAYSTMGETLCDLGLAQQALEPMARSVELFRELGVRHGLARNLIFQARAMTAAGLPQQALAVLQEAHALNVEHRLHSLHVGVSDALADLHHRFTLPAPAGMTLPDAALHYAEAALAEGRRVQDWKAPARLLSFLAERWAGAGDHARAYGYARQALESREKETQQQMNYPLTLVRLRRRGARAAAVREVAEERPRRQASQTLTPKERSILVLLARNYSNKEIAKQIEVSDETVKWHLKNLFGKLEASSRKEAVARARSLGFITFSE